MTTIYAAARDQLLVATQPTILAEKNVGSVRLYVEFAAEWAPYSTRSAIFTTSKRSMPYEEKLSKVSSLPETYQCIVPSEVLAEKCDLYIAVYGLNTEGKRKSTTRLTLRVQQGAPSVLISDPTPNVYQQLRTQLSILSARMDDHTVPADGDAIKDVCTTIDGTVYSSAGTAVRTQVQCLMDGQRHIGEGGRSTFTPYAKWKFGGLNNAVPDLASYRVHSENVMHFDRAINVRVAEGFRVGVHRVTETGTFVSDSGWRQGEFVIPTNTYFKMVVARTATDEDTSENADVAEFSNAVTFDSYTLRAVGDLSEVVGEHDTILSTMTEKETLDVKGAYFATGGSGALNNRIHASDIACDVYALITFLDTSKEMFYGVDLYTNDGKRTQISTSGWMRTIDRPTFVVTQSCLIDLSIAKLDSTSYSKLSDMDGLFTVTLVRKKAEETKSTASPIRRNWLTSAHQGFVDSLLKPNTLAAYYNARLSGADMIETDARLSSDGVLMVCHDPTVTGTVSGQLQPVTYTIADTPASTLTSLALSDDVKWGTQYVPTLAQVLHLAYHTGLQVNIDLKDGTRSAAAVAELVREHGMQGKVVYALNGSGMTGINTIMSIDPDARFIDSAATNFMGAVADFAERGKRCYAYTSDTSEATVKAIRAGGCMVALISLNASNFEQAIARHPDMCEYLHTSDFQAIEAEYLEGHPLY